MELTKHTLIDGTEERLLKLADYLRNLPPQYGFEMQTFYDPMYTGGKDITDIDVCGTSACAVGHYAIMEGYEATEMGVQPRVITEEWLAKEHDCLVGNRMDWSTFATKEIGVPCEDLQTPIFDWLFGSEWTAADNTPEGAAARIDYFLEHGVPEVFAEQAEDEYPLDGLKTLYADYLKPTKGDK